MLTLAMTYFQTPSDFVDFLLPFGRQGVAQDFHHTAFRQRTRLSERQRGLCIRELGWSGRDLWICYNLKCVESTGSIHRPTWSIRHFAVSHTFDVEEIRQNWIMIKADQLLQKRLTTATGDRGLSDLRSFVSIDRAFAASLEIHLLLSDLAVENWRWYINHLDEEFQDLSRRTIANDVDVPPMSPVTSPPMSPVRSPTMNSNINSSGFGKPLRADTEKTKKSFRSQFSRTRTQTWQTMNSMNATMEKPKLEIYTDPDTGLTQPLPPGETADDLLASGDNDLKTDEYGQPEFAFSDLQDIHHVDSKANEAALVIKHNRSIISQIQEYYQYVTNLKGFPKAIADECVEDIDHFNMRLKGIDMDFKIQLERIEALLRLIADRKTLVCTPSFDTQCILTMSSCTAFLTYAILKAIDFSLRSPEPLPSTWKR